MKPKILMIVNEFPPVGESGVQRPLKLLKYLDKAGWDTYVVTPRKPSKNVLDHSLCDEIPNRTKIYWTASIGLSGGSQHKFAKLKYNTQSSSNWLKGFISGILRGLNHLLFPLDKQVGWVPFAMLTSLRLIKSKGIRNIYITAFPYSAFLIGIRLKKILGDKIHWVADYRDTWQFEQLLLRDIPAWRLRMICRWDERTLRTCDHAVFVTEYIRARYVQKYPWLERKASVITNGYDEEDFEGLEAVKWDKFTVMFMGRFYFPPDPRALLRALSRWQPSDFQMLHIGSMTHEIEEIVSPYHFFRSLGYKKHQEALEGALGADINLLLINDDVHSAGTYSGKLFELLRLGKPILALGPAEGVIKDLVRRSHCGEYVKLTDEKGILEALRRIRENPPAYKADPTIISEFSREKLCGQFIKLYD
jgi:glycosyltransferase involved in cell wall biosynthesis